MIKKLNHEIEYENTLNQINEDYKAGKITLERKEALISMATINESNIRKQEVNDANTMFNTRNAKENDPVYYHQCILKYNDELYIKCIYSFNDYCIASHNNLGECLSKLELNHSIKEVYDITKRMYEDVISNKLDLLHTSKDDLYKMYSLK